MVNNFFPTPIYSNKIDSELLTKIKVNLFEYIKENKDLFKTTQWKCNTKTNIFCEQGREFFPDYLKELILEHTSRYIVEGKFKHRPFIIEDCWVTLGGYGAFQELHDHMAAGVPTNGFSAVLYISIEPNKGGEFLLQSPIDTLVKILPESDNDLLSPQIHIEPEEGLLLSFPSWIKHGSLQYNSKKKKRISISWNVNFQ